MFTLTAIVSTSAQEIKEYKYTRALKLSPFEFGKSQFQLAYEHYFGNRSKSVVLLPSFILERSSEKNSSGVELGAQYRIYLSHSGGGRLFHNIGFYTGGYGVGLKLSEDYNWLQYPVGGGNPTSQILRNEVSSVEGGVLLGIQIDITERFILDFFVGGGVRYSDVNDQRATSTDNYYNYYGVFDREYTGIKPRVGFQLGITL